MKPKIFFIGMDNSSDQPLIDLMLDSGCSVASISSGRRNLAKTIKRNLVSGNDPLHTISDSNVYINMTYFENDDTSKVTNTTDNCTRRTQMHTSY